MNLKRILWVLLFVAITVVMVFTLFGPGAGDRSGTSSNGGTAAVVNDVGISVAEFRRGVEMSERNSGLPLDKLPAEQRDMFQKSIEQQTLNQMVMSEIAFQAASKNGVFASNGEVRDLLVTAPLFQENGRFIRDRYETYLSQIGQSPEEFERLLRKQIVLQRLGELFSTASMPSNSEVDQLSELQQSQADLRFLELSPEKLRNEKAISEAQVSAYMKDGGHQAAIKKYFDEHTLDFQIAEKVHARDILLRADEKTDDKGLLDKANALRAKLTAANFASVAEKESQDPRTAKKGGDLGTFERGHIDPHIESVAFGLKAGEISQPVKIAIGYVLIYVEEHTDARTLGQSEANAKIARILLAQANAPVALAEIKKAVESGARSALDASLKKYGLAWEKADGVNLGSPTIQKISDPDDVLKALAANNGKTGLIQQIVGKGEHQYALDIVSWKKAEKPPVKDELQRTLAMQTSEDSFQQWIRTAKNQASVTLNQRLIGR